MSTDGGSKVPAPPEEEEVLLVEERDAVRVVTLNRPKVLNCINLPMVVRLADLYEKWEDDDRVQLIILKAAGRVFSAGGDLRFFYGVGRSDPGKLTEIVYRKYWLDYHIGALKKPVVSLLHDLCIGGGAALAVHSGYQVVSEKTLYSAPEAAIGLHTDCGASYFLSRLSGYLGEYLALTGARLDGPDMVACGLATHYVPLENFSDLERNLLALASPSTKSVKEVLDTYSVAPKLREKSILHRRADIDKWFSKDSVEDILATLVQVLNETGDELAKDTIRLLERASPTGLKITFRSIREGRTQSLAECLNREFRLTTNIMRELISGDVYEGMRATVIERDNKPKWNPPSLCDVKPAALDLVFLPLPEEQELHLPSDGQLSRWQGKYSVTSPTCV